MDNLEHHIATIESAGFVIEFKEYNYMQYYYDQRFVFQAHIHNPVPLRILIRQLYFQGIKEGRQIEQKFNEQNHEV